jgi:hypothetical protein
MLIRNSFILAKSETTFGVDPSPVAANAIRVRSIDITPLTGERVERTLLTGYMGATAKTLLTQRHAEVTIEFEWAGSGTAGTAPRFGPLLTASCMAAPTTGSAVTGTAQAGSAGSITLASGASSVNDFYVGLPITITSGTGNGSKGLITAYVGSTKVATVQAYGSSFTPGASSGYSIPANLTYTPISTLDGVSNTSATIYAVRDKNLHVITGFRGGLEIGGKLGEVGVITIKGMGIYSTPVASSSTSYSYGAQSDALPIEAGTTSALTFLGGTPCLEEFKLDLGVKGTFRSLVGCSPNVKLERGPATGEVMIEEPEVATTDYYTKAADNTGASDAPFAVQQGGTAGNISTLFVRKAAIHDDISQADTDGVAMLTIPFMALPSDAGNDEVRLVFC